MALKRLLQESCANVSKSPEKRLSVYESSLLLFAKGPQVSFTNNRVECELRIKIVNEKDYGSVAFPVITAGSGNHSLN